MSIEDTLYPLRRLYEAAPQPVKSLAGRAYRAIPAPLRYGKEYPRFAAEARESEAWSQADIESYQLRAVRESLLAAHETPFYRQRFEAAGVDPRKFESLSQLSQYPVLSKQDLILHREAMVNPHYPVSQRLFITTGGSTGTPVGFYLQKGVGRAKEQAFLEMQWARRGYRPGHRVAVMRGGVTSHRANGSISYYDATRNWLVLSSYHLTFQRLPEYVEALNRFRPQHLHLYPSAALMLARCLEQAGKRLAFEPVSILCGSEKLTAESQQYLEHFFQAPVYHWYGHSERAVLAGQGRKSNHLYFWPSYGFVELGEPDAEGSREVIGTTFHNHVMPLIRYRTGDCVRLPKTPDAELPMLEIDAVVGRDYEFLVSATGRRISLTAMNMHHGVFDGLLAVQFHQPQPGVVEFHYQPGPRWRPSQADAITADLLAKLGDDFQLELREVESVRTTPSGKACWLVGTEAPAQQVDANGNRHSAT